MVARATGALLVWSLWATAALAEVPLSAYAGEEGTASSAQRCDLYIAGVATSDRPEPLIYRWLDGAAEFSPWAPVRADGSAPVELCGLSVGKHVLTLEVTDGKRTASDTTTVTILDATAPVGVAANWAPLP